MTRSAVRRGSGSTWPEAAARGIVTAVRSGVAHRLGLSVAALALTLVLGIVYLVFGVFHLDPLDRKMLVRVHFELSGGILPDRDVTLRGVPVGQVVSVDPTGNGVVAVAAIDSDVRIPEGSAVRVAGLSLAGEQYLDFRPSTDDGPYLMDGAEISVSDTSTPVPLSTLMHDLDGMLAQIDPGQLETVVDELGVGPEGPRKLADLIDGGTYLISVLDSVLPQTVSLLHTSRTVLGTLAEAGPGLQAMSNDVSGLLQGVESMDGGFRTFVDRSPATLGALDTLFADNSPTMVQLLGNLATVAQMAHLRVPALQEFFFPADRDGSTLEGIGTAFRDGGVWAFVNIYPRYSCDYDLPRRPPSLPDFPEPYLYTYCTDEDPSILVRGARNAPRPAEEEDAAGPPPGVDPQRQSDATPVGPQSIPLEHAGPGPEWLAPR
ncbi:MlaD family protein [Rhodococcus chondri]|uniref:MlaD family protein n=1 Tax=Rhodococcus chondri TaxID=3065941 RepID=A0ABU7JX96_9NOCA|nr:MlaD family protein [Rhodococcus sp. CC-R104]MEE2033897.1 MlaD family protein [Rhodococcus sp. CC-R104]